MIEKLYALYLSIMKEMLELTHGGDSPHSVFVRVNHAIAGSIKFLDAFSVARTLMDKKPQRVLEVGSFIGMSTRWLCEIMQRAQKGNKEWSITAVDPNMRHRVFDNPRLFVEKLNAAFIPDNLEIVTSFFGRLPYSMYWYECEEANPKLDQKTVEKIFSDLPRITGTWDRAFDCIFIDANHSYESVHENFDQAVRLLNPGGIILFHDALTWPSVNKALTEIKDTWNDRASLEIIDTSPVLDHPSLKSFVGSSTCDGIGVFTLLH